MKNFKSTYLNTIILIMISLVFFCFFNFMVEKPKGEIIAKATNIEIEDDVFYEYLLELSNNNLDKNSFVDTTSLFIDSSAILNNEITIISGLNQFNWDNLESITIKNLYALEKIDLNYENFDDIFPNLDTIVVEGNYKLKTLNLGTGNNLTKLEVNRNSDITQLYLPNLQNCESIKFSQLNDEITDINLTGEFSHLKSIEINDSTCIKTLNFTNPIKLESASFINSLIVGINIQNAPKLENIVATNLLELENFVLINANNLRQFTFDEQDDDYIEITSPKLKTFIIKDNLFLSRIKITSSPLLNTINLENCSDVIELDLPKTLDLLVDLNLFNLVNLTTNFTLLDCPNVEILNLYNCKLLKDVFFEKLNDLNNLIYLNLEKTSIGDIILTNKNQLKNLYLGNYYALESVYLDSLPKVKELKIKNCEILKDLYIHSLPLLEDIDLYNVAKLENITISDTKLTELYIYDYSRLNSLDLSNNLTLETISVQICASLKTLKCAESSNLKTLILIKCPILKTETTKQFENFTKIEFLSIEYCDFFEDIKIKNCKKMSFLDLGGMSNLENISLTDIGIESANLSIILPSEFKKLKTLELVNLYHATLNNSELICNNGYVTKVVLDNVPIKKIDFSNNEIISITLKNLPLERVGLANNNISQFDKLISELETMNKLVYVNINANKIDFTDEKTLQLYTKSTKREKIIIGLQNVMNNNNYSYNPTIFIGNFDSNIKLNIYYCGNIETNPNTQYIDRSAYHLVEYDILSNFTLDGGTYIFKFTKFNGSEFIDIQEGDVSYYNYLPQYCAVLKSAPWYSNLWFILMIIAAAILIYVIVAHIYIKTKIKKEKQKKLDKGEIVEEEEYDNLNDDEEDEGDYYKKSSKKLKNNALKLKEEKQNVEKNESVDNNTIDNKIQDTEIQNKPVNNIKVQNNSQSKKIPNNNQNNKATSPAPKLPTNKKPPLPTKK